MLLANKADEWMDDEGFHLWERALSIFNVFRNTLYQLQSMQIPVHMDAISAGMIGMLSQQCQGVEI